MAPEFNEPQRNPDPRAYTMRLRRKPSDGVYCAPVFVVSNSVAVFHKIVSRTISIYWKRKRLNWREMTRENWTLVHSFRLYSLKKKREKGKKGEKIRKRSRARTRSTGKRQTISHEHSYTKGHQITKRKDEKDGYASDCTGTMLKYRKRKKEHDV